MAKFSITLDHDAETFNFFEHPKPIFSLQLNIFSALNALNNRKIPTQSISGDAETALILFSALANIDIDMELLVYKYFGDIPALMLRKVFANKLQSQEVSAQENKENNSIGTQEVLVVKSYTPNLSDAFKIKNAADFHDSLLNSKIKLEYKNA